MAVCMCVCDRFVQQSEGTMPHGCVCVYVTGLCSCTQTWWTGSRSTLSSLGHATTGEN